MSSSFKDVIQKMLNDLDEPLSHFPDITKPCSEVIELDTKQPYTKANTNNTTVVFLSCYCINNCSSIDYGLLDPTYNGPDCHLALCPCSYNWFASLRSVFKDNSSSNRVCLDSRLLFQSLLPCIGGSPGHDHYMEKLKVRAETDDIYIRTFPPPTNHWDNYVALPW